MASVAQVGGRDIVRKGLAKSRLRSRRAEILADTAARLLAGEDPDRDVLPALYQALTEERIVDASLGFVVTESGEAMKLAFIEGFDREMMQRCLTLDFGQAICGTVGVRQKAVHATDIQRTLDPMAELVRGAGINAYACEPLMVGDRFLGTLSFASRSRRRFDLEDLEFFHNIARLVAIARDRARRTSSGHSRPRQLPASTAA